MGNELNPERSSGENSRGNLALEEYFDVLDENGAKTGKIKLRQDVHHDGDWHQAVNIWIVTQNNEVLLQKRSAAKDSWPGYWDISAGGHVVAGEDPLTAAVQEIREELGVTVSAEALESLGSWKSSTRPAPDFINNSFNQLYLLRANYDIDDFTLQESEVEELRYVTLEELQKMLNTPAGSAKFRFVQHDYAYRKLLEALNR